MTAPNWPLPCTPRSVLMNEGVIVADGCTRDLLTDRSLMAANRLELP